jgi:hypothetical protein
MKKELQNILIGVVLCLLGYYLYSVKYAFLNYIGIVFILYGVFVVIIKASKVLLLLNGEFKNIRDFESKQNLTIPDFISVILKFRIKNNKEIVFEIPFYGTFYVLNYNNKAQDNFDNPNHINKEIAYTVKQRLYPLYNFSEIIPFAVNNNYTVLFFEEGKEEINIIDLDDSSLKPFKLENKLNFYLDIKNLEFKNDAYYYNGLKKMESLISENEYFYDVPDSIWEGKDYLEIFSKSFNLLDSKINYTLINVEEKNDIYILEMQIEDKIFKTYFNRQSHYIDSTRITIVLNEILSLIKYNPSKRFYLLSNSFCDFGIVLADQSTYQKLNENGCLEFDHEKQKITTEEIAIIRKYSDLDIEIENIEFHIKVIIKNEKNLKKGNQYHFTYKTNYIFDEEGITELKKRLKVIIVKIESGYEIFFIK